MEMSLNLADNTIHLWNVGDVSKIAAHQVSFVVMVQGQPMGYQVAAVEKTADGIRLTSDGTTLRWDLRDGTSETVTFDQVDTFAAEIEAFGVCLRDGTRPIHTEREGIAVLGMILAAYQGARTGTIAPVLRVGEAVGAG